MNYASRPQHERDYAYRAAAAARESGLTEHLLALARMMRPDLRIATPCEAAVVILAEEDRA